MNKSFTDFNGFKEAFKHKVESRLLPGWVWLCIAPDGKLILTQTNNQDNNLMMGVTDVILTPVLGLDMWEHAYWVDHDGDATSTYLEHFWQVVDWETISANYETYNLNKQTALTV